jgi:hypothetical protein
MTLKTINGEFMLYVSDKTGTGFNDQNLASIFKEDVRKGVRIHKAGDLIEVTGSIARGNGMIVLKNTKLAE